VSSVKCERFFSRNFKTIVDDSDATGLADRLFTIGAINQNDVEQTRELCLRREKMRFLIDAIVRGSASNNREMLTKVKSAFESEGYGHLVENIDNPIGK